MTHTLLTNHYNSRRILLASKNDQVALISLHDTVAIVERKGERFAVAKSKLKKI